MGKVLVVTSGKGGVGKTTTTAALGAALAQTGETVVVVDFDVGLRNLDLVMGAERRVVFDLINVIQGVAKLSQALIRDKRLETLWLLPASQTRDKDALPRKASSGHCRAREKFDWVICDSPAGIERGAILAMRYADAAVIVTNPEVSSVRDSDRIIGMLDSKTGKAENGGRIDKHLLITRYDSARASRGEMLSIDDVLEILSTPLLGIIPESEEVLRASNVGAPVTLSNRLSGPGRAYMEAARRLQGESVSMTVPTQKRGLFGKNLRTEGRMNLFRFLPQQERLGAGGARAPADPARPRTQGIEPARSAQRAARGDPRRGQATYRTRSRPHQRQDASWRQGFNSRNRHSNSERPWQAAPDRLKAPPHGGRVFPELPATQPPIARHPSSHRPRCATHPAAAWQ